MQKQLPIVITLGDPAGIGPEIFLKAMNDDWPFPITVIADTDLLQSCAQRMELDFRKLSQRFTIQHVPLEVSAKPSEPNSKNSPYILETLKCATEGCLQGRYHALVTGPVNKSVINDAGIPFSGHTQYLAKLTQTPKTVMMLASEQLKVALLTDHLPLKEVPSKITGHLIISTIKIINHDLQKRFGIADPYILVCGLNPHAGEKGFLGREEIEVMVPAIKKLQDQGYKITGPISADTAFTEKWLAKADVVLAAYHDQGLPVLKYQSFGRGVNITLGLPFIRTSVDHGTAYDIASRGIANAGSLKAAIAYAAKLRN